MKMNLPEGLHPVFGEITECIPGLDICQPLEIQSVSYSENFKPGPFLEAINVGKHQIITDFQIASTMKMTLPTTVFGGYDIKRKEPITLVHYKTVSDNDVSDLIKETEILRSLRNKFILEFYGIIYGTEVGFMYLSFEPFECYLSQLLCENHQELFEIPVVKCVMFQLYNGLTYLHEKEIVHRDLSTKNLAITEKGLLKISNFRNARKIGQCNEKVLTLDYSYQPVDMLLGSLTISTAIDIWSGTCIFGEILLKKKLFNSLLEVDVIKEIFTLLGQPHEELWPEFTELPGYNFLNLKHCSRYNNLNKYFKEEKSLQLLKKGFTYDPTIRISAEECLLYPYFAEEPKACSIKSFGMILHGRKFNFPVTYSKN